MQSTRYILSSDKGFTLPELLVTSLLGLLIVTLALTTFVESRNILGTDGARTRLNQNLRGSLDIIGVDARLAGENLSSNFPAVELTNASGSTSDILTVRRNLLDEVLPVCTTITGGTSVSAVYFAVPGTVAGCVYSGHTHNYNAWRTYRLAHGGQVDAYIYDRVAKAGEFFTYNSETDGGTSYYISRTSGVWSRNYPSSSSAVYILEEWQYQATAGMLQVIENRDTASPFNVSFGVTGFDVVVNMQDGTAKTAFTTADTWTNIASIEIALSGSDEYNGVVLPRTATSRFFPRNILSN